MEPLEVVLGRTEEHLSFESILESLPEEVKCKVKELENKLDHPHFLNYPIFYGFQCSTTPQRNRYLNILASYLFSLEFSHNHKKR